MKTPARTCRAGASTLQTRNLRLRHRATSAEESEQRGQDEQHDRNEEDDLRGFDRYARNAAKAENRGDDGDNQKRDGPAQHGRLLSQVTFNRFTRRMNV